MKDRVLLVGSYPPPFGGCSVHVMRLLEALRNEFSVEVIDLYGKRRDNDDPSIIRCGGTKPANAFRAIFAMLTHAAPIVHFHVASMDAFLIAAYPMLATLRRSTRKIITIHSGSFVERFRHGPAWRRLLLRDVMRRMDRIVTVNHDQRDFLEGIGITAARLSVIPAFLAPVARESTRARNALDELRRCERIIVSSGYGLPHYGFHHIVDALELLSTAGHRYGLLLCMYNSYNEEYVTSLERRFASGINGLVVRDLAPEEFAWILQRCDLYARATDRDGDAVAIREARYYGKPVIASDCVERAADVHLFRTDDSRSLAHSLSQLDYRVESSGGLDERAGLSALLEIYREAVTA